MESLEDKAASAFTRAEIRYIARAYISRELTKEELDNIENCIRNETGAITTIKEIIDNNIKTKE